MPVVVPSTATAGQPGSIIPQDSFVGDDGGAASPPYTGAYSTSDVNVTHSQITEAAYGVDGIKSLSGGTPTDHTYWLSALEPARLITSKTRPSKVVFQHRFMFDNAQAPSFLFGLVDVITAMSGFAAYGVFVTCAATSLQLVCNVANGATGTGDYNTANGFSVISGVWHNLEIEVQASITGAGVAIFRLDGVQMATVILDATTTKRSLPTSQPLRMFRGFVEGASGARYMLCQGPFRLVLQ